ncbi:exodeoxyribonuclease III [Salininema proteolyticum]|uniref:Exodeoxyribonuclease III n=1 Tax=Salininema proteolyticum TaxID=1607685 RepID=A0ABV8U4D3_9ACTN
MRIATWNVNSIKARLPRVEAWLDSADVDVLCLQELKCDGDAFPYGPFTDRGYEVAALGTGRWNGVAIASRVGLDDVERGLPGQPEFNGEAEPRAIAATCGGIRLWSLYVPNGRDAEDPHYTYKLEFLSALADAVPVGDAAPFALLGDMNICPTDEDLWSIADWAGTTHVTAPERDALAAVESRGLADVFPRALKHDRPFTFWDYRNLDFPKNRGMRIDLVLANPAAREAVDDAYVDRNERKGKGASDHAPVVVDLTL